MSDVEPERYVQQVICPAGSFMDDDERTALVTATCVSLAKRAELDGKQVVGALLDAEVNVTYLTAVLGTAEIGDPPRPVDFVAYEPSKPDSCDLVCLNVSAIVVPIEANSGA